MCFNEDKAREKTLPCTLYFVLCKCVLEILNRNVKDHKYFLMCFFYLKRLKEKPAWYGVTMQQCSEIN